MFGTGLQMNRTSLLEHKVKFAWDAVLLTRRYIVSVATEKMSLTYEGNRGQGVECMLCQATIGPAIGAGPPGDR